MAVNFATSSRSTVFPSFLDDSVPGWLWPRLISGCLDVKKTGKPGVKLASLGANEYG
jgi:hypothetical protein